jgi:hypothetical protein
MKRTIIPVVVLLSLLLAALATVEITTTSSSKALAQIADKNIPETKVPIHITKDATSSYTIMNSSSSVGSFDTTYTITGKINEIMASKDLIVSTVESDFNASATIGYIRANATTTTTTTTPTSNNSTGSQTLPNPFASSETINQKIESEISQAIKNATSHPSQQEIKIMCGFGMQLSDFSCSETPLIVR